jgi:hypothetical protein
VRRKSFGTSVLGSSVEIIWDGVCYGGKTNRVHFGQVLQLESGWHAAGICSDGPGPKCTRLLSLSHTYMTKRRTLFRRISSAAHCLLDSGAFYCATALAAIAGSAVSACLAARNIPVEAHPWIHLCRIAAFSASMLGGACFLYLSLRGLFDPQDRPESDSIEIPSTPRSSTQSPFPLILIFILGLWALIEIGPITLIKLFPAENFACIAGVCSVMIGISFVYIYGPRHGIHQSDVKESGP